ncbi:Receptor-like proteiny region [Forsythia ovata]|uniref:RING-type E3 ubiquitin transferase n=1 Tax=Forsythia ovata TaxID=205694 RepID=A0ABD1QCV1_9LAMI
MEKRFPHPKSPFPKENVPIGNLDHYPPQISLEILIENEMIKLFFCIVFLCHLINPSSSIVHLKSTSQLFVDSPARFTRRFNGSRICGALHLADPLDACSSLLNEVEYGDPEIARIALIVRGKCAFDEKIRNAQNAGFRAAVVYDDQHNHNLISMMGNPEGIWMPAVFVANEAGETLRKHAQAEESQCCIISSLDETAWTVLVISFISLLVVVSLLATIFFTYNHRQNQQGTRHVIDDKVVDILPCITFDAAQLSCYTGETCAICLEDYRDGESLKILPCQHEQLLIIREKKSASDNCTIFADQLLHLSPRLQWLSPLLSTDKLKLFRLSRDSSYFHVGCVNSWLTKWATSCPVCKHDIRA